MLPKAIGSQWVTNVDGKLWPIVLVDDATPPKEFINSKPNGYLFPAIQLGKVKYIWVADNKLREYDPHKEYAEDVQFATDDILDNESEEAKLDKHRLRAFSVHAPQFESPKYWSNFIKERSAARALERQLAVKRKRQSEDGDEIKVLSGPRSNSLSASPSRHPRFGNQSSSSKKGHLPTPVSNKKQKLSAAGSELSSYSAEDLFVRGASIQSDPFVDSGNEEDKRARNRQVVKDRQPNDDTYTIFVGPEQTPFWALKEKVGKCDFLANRVAFTEELRCHVDLEDTNIKAKDFISVAEYLSKGDFSPRLLDMEGHHQRLEGIILAEEKDKAATEIAKVHLVASKIRFEALQLPCIDKMKVLHPLRPNNLLIVLMLLMKAEQYDCDVEKIAKDWVVDHMVELFWILVEREGPTLARVMCDNADLRQNILAKLQQNPAISVGLD